MREFAHFLVAGVKHHDQVNLQKKGLITPLSYLPIVVTKHHVQGNPQKGALIVGFSSREIRVRHHHGGEVAWPQGQLSAHVFSHEQQEERANWNSASVLWF